MEEERREHVMKMKKMEAEMEQVFEMKVKEKKQKLKDSEAEVRWTVCVRERAENLRVIKVIHINTCSVKYMKGAFKFLQKHKVSQRIRNSIL